MNAIQNIIAKLTQREDLTDDEMTLIMRTILSGELTATQTAAFLVALRMKGETVSEITSAVKTLHEFANKILFKADHNIDTEHLIDIVGTGGDNSNLFNISTISAFVAAAAGATVAKHGNRSVSSKSGSADVLEAAGANLDVSPEQVIHCLKELGIGFLFAQKHHSAMRHVANIRKELGIRTLFNILGPLANPAGVKRQVLGVYDKKWLVPFAKVCQQLGSKHVLVVHSTDGLDEISLATLTQAVELKQNEIREFIIEPENFGIKKQRIDSLTVQNPMDSVHFFKQVLNNEDGPARDIVALNAGAAIYVAGIAVDMQSGVNLALKTIASGAAKDKFNKFIVYTQKI